MSHYPQIERTEKTDNFVINILRISLVFLFLLSSIAKISAVNYTADLIVQLFPIGYFSLTEIEYLRMVTIFISVSEFIIAAMLSFNRSYVFALKCSILFLLFFLILNGFQFMSDARDCGCFGGLIKLTPIETLIKTIICLTICVFTLRKQNELRINEGY